MTKNEAWLYYVDRFMAALGKARWEEITPSSLRNDIVGCALFLFKQVTVLRASGLSPEEAAERFYKIGVETMREVKIIERMEKKINEHPKIKQMGDMLEAFGEARPIIKLEPVEEMFEVLRTGEMTEDGIVENAVKATLERGQERLMKYDPKGEC